MYLLITPRRVQGVAIPKDQVSNVTPFKGDMQIVESQCAALGRITRQAFLLSSVGHAPGILPHLLDASVTSLGTQGMTISGVEQIGQAFYFQS